MKSPPCSIKQNGGDQRRIRGTMIFPKENDGKPDALPLWDENVPDALRNLAQWGVWRFEQHVDEKTGEIEWDKVPGQSNRRAHASSTNERTWSPFADAWAAYQRGGHDGLAFFMRQGSGIVGIDLDKCRDPETGKIDAWTEAILYQLRTYTELSPSGRGFRCFLFAELPPQDRREGPFECYSTSRFLSITGHRLVDLPATVEHRQDELIAIHTQIFAARVANRNAAAAKPLSPVVPHNLSDIDVIAKAGSARNGAKFRQLYSGDWSGYPSPSEADLARIIHRPG
jgi:primase-polymerase (primpol)-like protein